MRRYITQPMLTGFFLHLKAHKLPVSTRELLTLLEALEKRVISLSIDDFYTLSRACFVKDEQHFDRFDLAFGTYFKGIDAIFDIRAEIPEEWLRKEFERYLSDEDKKLVEAMGGLGQADGDAQEAPRGAAGPAPGRQQVDRHRRHQPVRRVRLQPGRRAHRPGRRRLAQRGQGLGRAQFRNLDGDVELNTRNIKVALRRLRRFAREGVPDELDLAGHHRGHGAQRGLARPAHAARAAQPGQGAAVPRRRRLDGPARARVRGALLGGEGGVPPSRVFLFPQLRVRPRVARQRPAAQRARCRPSTSSTRTGRTGR